MTTASFVATPGIVLAGTDRPDLADNLLALTVQETVAGMSHCELRASNFGFRDGHTDFLYLGRDVLDFGADIAVRLGPADTGREVFAGRISAIQGDYPHAERAQVLVFAEDALQGLRLTRRTRTFDDASTADVAARLATEHGLTPQIDLDGPTRRVAAQVNQSDLAFLRALARRDDGEVWLDGRTLHVARRPDRDGDRVTLSYGLDLLSFSVRADLAHQVTEVAVTGWDVSGKEAIDERADAGELAAELADGDTSGAAALGPAFGDRVETLARATPLAPDDARALARAAYLERARRFVCGTGTTSGTPQLRVGSTVVLGGLGRMFNGSYRVTRTRHLFDMLLGLRSEFDVERAGVGATS